MISKEKRDEAFEHNKPYLNDKDTMEDLLPICERCEQYGRDFAPVCAFEVYELNDNMGWGASVEIGDCYYETDAYKDKQDAIDEQRGCLLAIKEQIEKYLENLD